MTERSTLVLRTNSRHRPQNVIYPRSHFLIRLVCRFIFPSGTYCREQSSQKLMQYNKQCVVRNLIREPYHMSPSSQCNCENTQKCTFLRSTIRELTLCVCVCVQVGAEGEGEPSLKQSKIFQIVIKQTNKNSKLRGRG